jgi:hypothetical protein
MSEDRRRTSIPRQKFDFVNPKSTPEPQLRPNPLKTQLVPFDSFRGLLKRAVAAASFAFEDFASRHPPIPLLGDQDANSRSAAA